jgi:hypothetical protein
MKSQMGHHRPSRHSIASGPDARELPLAVTLGIRREIAHDQSLGRCPGPHEKGVPEAWREAIWKLALGLMDFNHHEA